jgi:hypothetical protein
MKAIELNVPDEVYAKLENLASRANRVDWQKVDDILDRVPSAPPLPGDEIP